MKKILAILLVLMMVLVSVAALAAEGDPVTETPDLHQEPTNDIVTITKKYTIEGDTAVNPADVLKFKVEGTKIENATDNAIQIPAATIANVTVNKAATTASINIKLPTYTVVGEYYYTITEEDTGVAGVTYLSKPITMKVQVFQGETGLDRYVTFRIDNKKIDSFENKYEAGTLTVSKTVTGSLGDRNKDWTFTVVFTAPDGDTVVGDITATASGATVPGGWPAADAEARTATATFTLKHGQSVTFSNIPKGVSYVIKEAEANADGYTTKVGSADYVNADGFSGSIATSEDDTAAFNNDKDVEIDTGVALDFVPYVLIMALALAGFVTMKIRRREDY